MQSVNNMKPVEENSSASDPENLARIFFADRYRNLRTVLRHHFAISPVTSQPKDPYQSKLFYPDHVGSLMNVTDQHIHANHLGLDLDTYGLNPPNRSQMTIFPAARAGKIVRSI